MLALVVVLVCGPGRSIQAQNTAGYPDTAPGSSHRSDRIDAARSIPFHRLNGATSDLIRGVVHNPSFYRRMPTQRIECDAEMFDFLVRRPEIMVNIWDLMGITNVRTRRVGPYSFLADDGMGTTCRCDLVYQAPGLHIYVGTGEYDGSLSPRKVTGNCVCVLRSHAARDETGRHLVTGTMDVFLKLDSLGADLITRTVGPFMVKTADYNFVETARFVGEIYHLCRESPYVAQVLAQRLDKIDPQVQQEFARLAASVAARDPANVPNTRPEQTPIGRPVAGASPRPTDHAGDRPELAALPMRLGPALSGDLDPGTDSGVPSTAGGSASRDDTSAGARGAAARARIAPRKKLLYLRR